MEHQHFFRPNLKYRAPGFVATSFKESVAKRFCQRQREAGRPAVLWRIHIQPEGCRHVNLLRHTHVEGEEEFLFAPYSVFKVLAVQWSHLGAAGANAEHPHIVDLEAAVDNAQESEDLPLPPWH